MLVKLLLGLLADLVFDYSARARRTFQAEFRRYLADRGFAADAPSQRSSAH